MLHAEEGRLRFDRELRGGKRHDDPRLGGNTRWTATAEKSGGLPKQDAASLV
jgi:hypothetical protein